MMPSIRLLGFFLTLMMALPLSTQSADNNGNFAVWGQGTQSCHQYIKAKDTDQITGYKDYIMGFLTAVNIQMEDTYSLTGRMTLKDILAWLDDYCEAQSVHSFDQALINFSAAHYEKRLKRPRSRFRR